MIAKASPRLLAPCFLLAPPLACAAGMAPLAGSDAASWKTKPTNRPDLLAGPVGTSAGSGQCMLMRAWAAMRMRRRMRSYVPLDDEGGREGSLSQSIRRRRRKGGSLCFHAVAHVVSSASNQVPVTGLYALEPNKTGDPLFGNRSFHDPIPFTFAIQFLNQTAPCLATHTGLEVMAQEADGEALLRRFVS